MSNERYVMRDAIFRRVDLSTTARLLYLDLDNRARTAGKWFVKRQRLAAEMGISLPNLDRATKELSDAGLVKKERNSSSCTYVLAWSDSSPAMNQEWERVITRDESDLSPVMNHHLNVLNPVKNPGRKPPPPSEPTIFDRVIERMSQKYGTK